MINKRLISLVFCLAGLFLASCASTQIKDMESSGNFKPEADEARLWKRAAEFQEVVDNGGFIYRDEELTKYINTIMHKLVGDFEKSNNVSLRVYIIEDPFLNAVCLPNGTVYVHTGLLANADNEAQLATVLGHEATHFLHRHILREFRSMINKSAFMSFLSVTFAGGGSAGSLASLLAQYCVIGSFYGYGRELEREADKNAFELIRANGYSYLESKKLMENLYEATKDEKNKTPYFYQNHPRLKERIATYEQFIKELSKAEENKGVPEGVKNEDVYNKMIKNVLADNIELELKRKSTKLAKKQIERYNKLYPEDFRGIYLMGKVYFLEDKKEDAEKELRRSIQLNPDYGESHKTLGLLYYKKKEKQKANAEFREYLRLRPDAIDADYIKRYLNEGS